MPIRILFSQDPFITIPSPKAVLSNSTGSMLSACVPLPVRLVFHCDECYRDDVAAAVVMMMVLVVMMMVLVEMMMVLVEMMMVLVEMMMVLVEMMMVLVEMQP